MKYLTKSTKSTQVLNLMEQAIDILVAVDVPTDNQTQRGLERMAMAFLAVAGVTKQWQEAQGFEEGRILKTREIITFINANFEEHISSGSYDDIRRKDLKLLVLAGLIWNSANNPNAATNDPTRGYTLETSFKDLIRTYRTAHWESGLSEFLKNRMSLKAQLARKRTIETVPVTLLDGKSLRFSPGPHNELQKLIIEEFLPRFGKGCQVLYIGDTANKILHIDQPWLASLNFFELAHDKLPDIIAYHPQKNWLYLIEAVHSSGLISEVRMLELKQLTQTCKAEIIFVTAFLSRTEFRKWSDEIAWETEVWIASTPDHLIHFNGEKFLGPYSN